MESQFEPAKNTPESPEELFAGEVDLRRWLLQQNLTPSEIDDLIIETNERLKQRQ